MPASLQVQTRFITVPPDRRALDEAAVTTLAESMSKIGLLTPITIRTNGDGELVLVAGGHRLAAALKLGWKEIDCIEFDGDEIDAELWEIAENLHRAELSALQRDEQIVRWVELMKLKVAQVATPLGGKQPKESGIRKAARDLRLDTRDVQRATKTGKLTPEAKTAIQEAGLENNRSAYLRVAEQPQDEQVRYVQFIATPREKDWDEVEAEQKRRLMHVWNGSSPTVKDWFLNEVTAKGVAA